MPAGHARLAGNAALRAAITQPLPEPPCKVIDSWPFVVKPFLILAPGEHSWNSPALSKWRDRLAALGKVVMCPESASMCHDPGAMARTLLRKVQDVRAKVPKRPVVLVGMSVGAKVAIIGSPSRPAWRRSSA
jgi:hypothetical protein